MKKLLPYLFMIMSIIGMILLGLFTPSTQAATVTKTFSWTAPGDDGDIGTAARYEMRYTTDTTRPWSEWIDPQPAAPKIAGSAESFTVTVDLATQVNYWFGLITVDDAGNRSGRSNLVLMNVPDAIPPATIVDFR